MKGTIVPNPFAPVEVTIADREALYGGLISAGHLIEYARHQADTLPVTDGALQMLARHRFAARSTQQPAQAEVDCERCQGNGELVTDWDRYMHAHPGDKGDESVADCPDCDGTGRAAALHPQGEASR